MAQSFEKEILEIKKVYSKISYDLSKIKSIPKIYDAYKIKNDEKIIAFAKSSAFLMPLTMSGVIITDKALYINPFNGSLVNENALPFEELCSYVISLPDEKSALDLVGIGIQKEIWGNILGRNVIGGELQSFLLALQEKLSGKYSWAIEQQNKLLDKAINNNAIEIQTCSLSRETKYIFDYFIQKKQYSDKVAPFVVERIYRKRGMADAKEFISILDGSVSPTGINSLHANLPLLEKNFLKDISNISLSFDREYVIKLLENPQLYICSDDTSTFKFEAYLSARLGDVERFKKAQNIILQASGNTEAFKLEHFICLSLNKLMQSVYDSISKNQMPSAHLLKIKDNFGFDALHYAIILGKESEVYNFSPYAIWSDTSYEMLVNMPDSNLRRFVDIDFSENLTSISIEDFSSQITYSFQKPSKELIWHFIKNYDTNVRIPYRIPAHIFEGRHESLLEKSLIALLNIVIRLPSTLILKSTQPKSKDNFQSRAQSFLFNLAYNYDYVLKPVNEYEDLFPKRISSNRRRLRKLEDMEAPQLSFNQELVEQYYMSLISEDPFVKFIGFYHIMEHFFEDVYNEELLSNVQNIIRHPGFSSKRKKDVAKIIDLIKNKTKQNKEDFSGSELEALELTLKKFINITELNNYLTEYDVTIIDYYKTNEVSFSKVDMIDLRDIANEKLFKKLAARIYKTRNALVHSKSNEGRIRERGIYNPFEDKKQLLMEIPLMRYISETIIINNSQSL